MKLNGLKWRKSNAGEMAVNMTSYIERKYQPVNRK
jgi:hypothetical protein